jgi:hypothetical protein
MEIKGQKQMARIGITMAITARTGKKNVEVTSTISDTTHRTGS